MEEESTLDSINQDLQAIQDKLTELSIPFSNTTTVDEVVAVYDSLLQILKERKEYRETRQFGNDSRELLLALERASNKGKFDIVAKFLRGFAVHVLLSCYPTAAIAVEDMADKIPAMSDDNPFSERQ